MGKAKTIGQFKTFLPNSRADMRRRKQYRRSREYTAHHEEIMESKRETRRIKEMVAQKCSTNAK